MLSPMAMATTFIDARICKHTQNRLTKENYQGWQSVSLCILIVIRPVAVKSGSSFPSSCNDGKCRKNILMYKTKNFKHTQNFVKLNHDTIVSSGHDSTESQ